ncbi:MAG: hypothetical protein ACQEQE_02460 [Bacillota bacterium]
MKVLERGFIFKKVDINEKEKVNYYIKELTLDELDSLMTLQNEIHQDIPDEYKETYVCKPKKEFKKYLENGGIFLGIYVDNKLIGARITETPKLSKKNLGYFLDFTKDQLLKTMHFKTMLVKKEFRGNNLQIRSMNLVEKMFIKRGYKYGMCRISPNNYYSLSNALKFGLKIQAIKLQFQNKENTSSKLRCILNKKLDATQPITFEKIEYVKNTNIDRQLNLIEDNYVGFKAKNFNKIDDFTIVYGKDIHKKIIT